MFLISPLLKTPIMRQILSISKFSLLCFIASYVFVSCQAPRLIIITGGNLTNDSLTMVDSSTNNPAYTLYVHPGDKIKWKINDPNSHVKGFDSISIKLTKSQFEVFEVLPHKKFLSKSWVGFVKDSINLKGYTDEYYNIIWKGSDQKNHKFDPRIIVGP
jgi:hypothetical protein